MKAKDELDVMREQMSSDQVYDVVDEWLKQYPELGDAEGKTR